MSSPPTYRDDKARRTKPPPPEPAAPPAETRRAARDTDEETHLHHVTEDLLNQMARELAKRLNSMLDTLAKPS